MKVVLTNKSDTETISVDALGPIDIVIGFDNEDNLSIYKRTALTTISEVVISPYSWSSVNGTSFAEVCKKESDRRKDTKFIYLDEKDVEKLKEFIKTNFFNKLVK